MLPLMNTYKWGSGFALTDLEQPLTWTVHFYGCVSMVAAVPRSVARKACKQNLPNKSDPHQVCMGGWVQKQG